MFRKEALQRLAEPDNLDQLMQLTRPARWFALGGAALLLVIAVGWGFFWTSPVTLETTGVLAPAGGVTLVAAPETGRLREVMVKPGDIVTNNQTLATIQWEGPNPAPITTPGPGRVIAVSAGVGDAVEQGAPILTLAPAGAPLQFFMYVPVEEATGLRPGLDVRISPTGLSPSVFGYLKGEVISVGSFPVTARQMRDTLGTEEVVRAVAAEGALLQVVVQPEVDESTPSGFAWTNADGPPFPLSEGTFANSTTTLRRERPFRIVKLTAQFFAR